MGVLVPRREGACKMTDDRQLTGRLRVALILVLAGLVFGFTVSARAGSGSVDPTFDAGTGWKGRAMRRFHLH